MSLEGAFTWFSGEVKWALFFVLLILLMVTGFKRAWIAMIGVIIGLAFIGIFIVNPNILITISEWLSGLLNFGG